MESFSSSFGSLEVEGCSSSRGAEGERAGGLKIRFSDKSIIFKIYPLILPSKCLQNIKKKKFEIYLGSVILIGGLSSFSSKAGGCGGGISHGSSSMCSFSLFTTSSFFALFADFSKIGCGGGDGIGAGRLRV